MGKVIIRCVKCGGDKWIPRHEPMEHSEDKKCSDCGALYCAKNRKWSYED